MILVIAGNYEQGRNWIKEHVKRRIDAGDTDVRVIEYTYVSGIDSLRGYSDPHGYFVGDWRSRKDLRDIVQTLLMAQRNPSPVLMTIWKEIR